MATITIKKGYLEILNTLGSADTIVENALRKYLIDKSVDKKLHRGLPLRLPPPFGVILLRNTPGVTLAW